MLPTRRELITGTLLATIALLAWWYGASNKPETLAPTDAQRKPDFVVEDLNGVTMDLNGRPARLLATPLLRHYPDDESSELDAPVMTVFNPDAPPWVIGSERGWISAGGDELLLQGPVRAERASAPDLAAMVLVTSELLVLPEADYAETDRFAELERGEDWVTATDGMQIWFGEQMRVKLFGRNRTRLAPTSDLGDESSTSPNDQADSNPAESN
ncbi:MAG: LPS export ABC transporter periplasmic protein LptC [Thiohalocapsa sp.]